MRISDWSSTCALPGLGAHAAHFDVAGLLDRDFDQVADDGVYVAADIAHFGELGGLDLDEGGVGQFGQAARDFGLAYTGGPYHEIGRASCRERACQDV